MLELVVGLVIVPELEVEDVLDVDDVLELDVVGSCITDGNLHCNPPSLTHVPPRFVQSSNATPDEELELDVLEVLEVLPVELDGYEYKKLFVNFEWANADGSNGGSSGVQSTKNSTGFYTTIGYRITPKLQILARYDQFDPDKNIRHNNRREYSVGLNYFVKGQALRLIVNYVFCQNDSAKDSHRIMLGTQILL